MATLFHKSGWQHLGTLDVGDTFTLRPGTQCAEGVGVYFAEGVAVRDSTAEGTHTAASITCVVIEVADSLAPVAWWRSKAAKARKFKKPRTWHSNGAHIACTVERVSMEAGCKTLHCSWAVA